MTVATPAAAEQPGVPAEAKAIVVRLRPSDVRPAWLRPGALAMVVGLHVGTVGFLTLPRADVSATVDSIEITVARGAPEEPPPPPEEKPPEPPPPEPPPEPTPEPKPPELPPPVVPPPPPPPEPEPPVVADPPKRVARDAPVIAARPKVQPPRPKPADPTPAVAPPPPPQDAAPGATEAAAQLAQARLTFVDKVRQEIRRHQIHAIGVGSVVVSFIVDVDGSPGSIAVVRSSGKDVLDGAALSMVHAIRPGPPPDGRFEARMLINFVE